MQCPTWRHGRSAARAPGGRVGRCEGGQAQRPTDPLRAVDEARVPQVRAQRLPERQLEGSEKRENSVPSRHDGLRERRRRLVGRAGPTGGAREQSETRTS